VAAGPARRARRVRPGTQRKTENLESWRPGAAGAGVRFPDFQVPRSPARRAPRDRFELDPKQAGSGAGPATLPRHGVSRVTDAPSERDAVSWWDALRRRKVVQWGVAYVAGAWGFLQGLEYVSDAFHWPEQSAQERTFEVRGHASSALAK
jgi:hypothetical protein